MSSLGKRTRSDIAAAMMKKVRREIKARPRSRTPKSGHFEGLRHGVATSGSPGPEIKNWDTNISSTAVLTGTPYIASLTAGIAEGTAGNQRIGNKILVRGLDVRLDFQAQIVGANATGTTAAACPPAFCDVFLVWDKQPDNAVPSVATIFSTTTTPLTFGNVGQLDRFVVLRRERLVMDPVAGISGELQLHVPLELASRFPDATGSPNTNDLYLVAIGNTASAANTMNAAIAYSSRVKFVDA